MGWIRLAWVACVFGGCAKSAAVDCGDYVCPEGDACDLAHAACVLPFQLESCAGLAPLAPCMLAATDVERLGICDAGVCIESRCGDGLLVGLEQCEAGILPADKDECSEHGFYPDPAISDPEVTCSSACTFVTSTCGALYCGNGAIEIEHGEYCDTDVLPLNAFCRDFGYDLGRLGCSAACGPALDACERWDFAPVYSGTTTDLNGVWGATDTDVYAVGAGGTILHWDGVLWSPQVSGTTVDLYAVTGRGPSDVWAVGDGGVVLRNDGSGWTSSSVGKSSADLRGIYATTGTVVVVGKQTGDTAGFISHWSDTDAAWTERPIPSGGGSGWQDVALFAVSGSSASNIWAVGYNELNATEGWVFRWEGTFWAKVVEGPLFQNIQMRSVWVVDANELWIAGIAGAGGVAIRGLGGTFTATSIPATYGVTGDAATGRVYFTTADGLVIRDRDNNYLLRGGRLDSIWTSGGRAWGVGPRGRARRFDGSARLEGSKPQGTPDRYIDAWGWNANRIYLATQYTVRHWNGSAWRLILTMPPNIRAIWVGTAAATSATLHLAAGDAIHVCASNDASESCSVAYTELGFAPRDIWGSAPNNIYAVGEGGVVHFNGTWTKTVIAGVSLHAVWGTSASDVVAAGIDTSTDRPVIYKLVAGAWQRDFEGTTAGELRALWGASGEMHAGGSTGMLRRTSTGWTPVDIGTAEPIQKLFGTSATDIWAVTTFGGLHHFDGATWSPARLETDASMFALWAGDGRVLAAGDGESVMLLRP